MGKNPTTQNEKHIYFVGAGPGDPELITVKGKRLLESAATILYTGSLIPDEMLRDVGKHTLIQSSEQMSYEEIFNFIETHIDRGLFVRLHTGDPSIYSTTAKQIAYLRLRGYTCSVVPGVTSAFAASASAKIELTIPGVSQGVLLTRASGKSPNPEQLDAILSLKHTSIIFYLSVLELESIVQSAIRLGWEKDTPCWIVERASHKEERWVKATLDTIVKETLPLNIKGTALIFMGDFLHQQEREESHLYSSEYNQK